MINKGLILTNALSVVAELQTALKGESYVYSPHPLYKCPAIHLTDVKDMNELFPFRKVHDFVDWGDEECPHIHEISYGNNKTVFYTLIDKEDVPEWATVLRGSEYE